MRRRTRNALPMDSTGKCQKQTENTQIQHLAMSYVIIISHIYASYFIAWIDGKTKLVRSIEDDQADAFIMACNTMRSSVIAPLCVFVPLMVCVGCGCKQRRPRECNVERETCGAASDAVHSYGFVPHGENLRSECKPGPFRSSKPEFAAVGQSFQFLEREKTD